MSIPANQAKAVPASTFTQFAQLPPEIREEIWFHVAHCKDRVVWLTRNLFGLHATPLAPAMLHVNSEARTIGLKYYTITVGLGELFSRTYINPRADAIRIDDLRAFRHVTYSKLYRDSITALVLTSSLMSEHELDPREPAIFGKFERVYGTGFTDPDLHQLRDRQTTIATAVKARHRGFDSDEELIAGVNLLDCGVVELRSSTRYQRKTIALKVVELRELVRKVGLDTSTIPPNAMSIHKWANPERAELETLMGLMYPKARG